MKSRLKHFSAIVLSIIVCAAAVAAQVVSNSPYTIDQTVVATGGGTSSDAGGSLYKIDGTSGQASAGTFVFASGYSIRSGFWTPGPFAPTAAQAALGGRVVGPSGGLRNVTVQLSGGRLFVPRQTRTNSFGYFTFENVEVGQTYLVTVKNRKYGFAQDSQVISLVDNVSDLLFEATWEN
jgi:hypothetical protein